MDSRRTVLLVDDEPSILKALGRNLSNEPYNKLHASGVDEALGLLDRYQVHVIVTDLGMPGNDGLELLSKVQKSHPHIIRLILSAAGDSGTLLKAITVGWVYRYILKPWEETELKLTIRQAIELYDLQEQNRELIRRLEEQNTRLMSALEGRTGEVPDPRMMKNSVDGCQAMIPRLENRFQAIYDALRLWETSMGERSLDLPSLKNSHRAISECARDIERVVSCVMHQPLDPDEKGKGDYEFCEFIRNWFRS